MLSFMSIKRCAKYELNKGCINIKSCCRETMVATVKVWCWGQKLNSVSLILERERDIALSKNVCNLLVQRANSLRKYLHRCFLLLFWVILIIIWTHLKPIKENMPHISEISIKSIALNKLSESMLLTTH